MGKFPFKRPRIISKKFPEMDSTIDGVTKSLDNLIFSYREGVEKALQKKHVMMAISSMVLLVVLGSFISPKGKAESSIFYPETCLGGWINPQLAEGELQTTSNDDKTQFRKDNSAILPKNTNAEMYCGHFKGTFDSTTKPTKIIVSLALTKGDELQLGVASPSVPIASSSLETLVIASTTLASTTDASSTLASTTPLTLASSTPFASSTESLEATTTVTSSLPSSSEVTAIPASEATSSVPATTILDGVVQSVQDTFNTLFNSGGTGTIETDTVVIPPLPAETPTPPADNPPSSPTSYLNSLQEKLLSYLVQKVFAEESDTATESVVETITTSGVTSSDLSSSTDVHTPVSVTNESLSTTTEFIGRDVLSTSTSVIDSTSTTDPFASSTLTTSTTTAIDLFATSTLTTSTTTASTTESLIVATSTEDDNEFQNNFLEVLYTYDGITWMSLGNLNEISMKYRTFEIPVTASTSWNDLSKLQIKIVSKQVVDETPSVLLDGIKVEVLYETTISHAHPDFARDTILKDEIIDNIRLVTIVNNETKEQEIWYMFLDQIRSQKGEYVVPVASSTIIVSSTSDALLLGSTTSTTTALQFDATTTSPIVDLLKNTWKKFQGNNTTLSSSEIIEEIKKQESVEKRAKISIIPDFALDTIKIMKGVFLDTVLVQVERNTGTTSDPTLLSEEPYDELWLYNTETGAQEKIGAGASSTPVTIAPDSPIGAKGGYLFWLSSNKGDVYAYNLADKKIIEKTVPEFDPGKGERAEILFEGLAWKVVLGKDKFSFYSEETGEVFSDEDSTSVEALRVKMGLDLVLNKEELSNLSLPVEAGTSSSTQP